MKEEPAGRTSPTGERVRARRMLRGLSQAQLAARVGRSLIWVDRLEHGDLDWVDGLERGRLDAAEVPVLAEVAGVLDIGVEDLVDPSASSRRVGTDRREEAAVPRHPAAPASVRPAAEARPAPSPPAAAASLIPSAPPPRRPSVPVRLVAAGAGIGVATGCAAIGIGLSRGAASAADHGPRSPASARVFPEPSPTAAPTPASTDAPAPPPPAAVPAATPVRATTFAPAPPPTPAASPAGRQPAPIARPAVRVAIASPAAPGRIRVFPQQVGVIVRAGSASGPSVTFTVSDTGAGPVTLGAVALGNPAAHVVSDTCSHATLGAQDVCDVTLSFSAAKAGWYGGALVIPVAGEAATRIPITVWAGS